VKNYPDPDRHFEEHIQRSAEHYVEGLQQAGLEANPTLTRAMAERARAEAEQSYMQEAQATRDHNISQVMSNYHKRNNQIKRESARLRLWACPPIAILFGLMAWYSFSQYSIFLGILYVVGALAFLAMLILGAIFDRPS
jgi:hypothetical protein